MSLLNRTVLMSGAHYFSNNDAINAYMDSTELVDVNQATQEHAAVAAALQSANIDIEYTPAPQNCQDGVYTANWALTRGKKAILASLPPQRQPEQPYAKAALEERGFEVIDAPYRFSGQGDALPCGNYVFMGSHYRNDPRMHQFVADTLGYEVVSLQTIPQLDANGEPQINAVSGWPDSFFYDIDLALSILRTDLIAWCPDAFVPRSQEIIRSLPLKKIEVSLEEATEGFACNLVSTGETVIMSAHAPKLQTAIEAEGLKTTTPEITELAKGGGYIRCTTLTLTNN